MDCRRAYLCVFIVSVASAFFPAGCCSANIAPSVSSSQSNADWMASIPGTKQITELSLPGSHDSGATQEPWRGTAKCQNLSIAQQLSAGVRFLDIRCRHVNNAFQIYHGAINQCLSFDSVLSSCIDFLKLHPTECVIMSVQEELTAFASSRTFEQTFDSYVSRNPDKWFLGDSIPRLEEVRGRLILFRRFCSSVTPKGIAAPPVQWQDNATFPTGNLIRVQDKYIVPNKDEKWASIQCLFHEAQTTSKDVLFLNFASGYQKEIFGLPNIVAVSDDINPKLSSYFQQSKPGRFGVTIMDFVDARKCELIIKTNQ